MLHVDLAVDLESGSPVDLAVDLVGKVTTGGKVKRTFPFPKGPFERLSEIGTTLSLLLARGTRSSGRRRTWKGGGEGGG